MSLAGEAEGRRALYLIRHGSTSCNEEGRICGDLDVGLSERGAVQARLAAELISTCRVDLVLSSPLRRTLETARAVAAPHGLEPREDEGLVELRLGRWTGQTRGELAADPLWQSWLEAPHTIATPGGERLEDVQSRALSSLGRGLASVPEGGGLVIVSHGGVIRALLLGLLGMPLAAYQKVRADPGSVSALLVDGERRLGALLGINLGDASRALRRGRPT